MLMPCTSKDAEDIVSYFQRVLIPDGVALKIKGETIQPRKAKYLVEASLPTEVFDGVRWLKPSRKTEVRIVPVMNGETPTVYEMGIPVCGLEWDKNYHLDIAQRVPMNPNRDAVSVGYLTRVHRAALPVLVNEMDAAGALADWVGLAAAASDEEVQRAVVETAFGTNAARSVPEMGKHSF